MFYTSGSTATAKSVAQNHRNLLYEICRHTNAFRVCAADRLAFIAPTNVIGGMREIFLALLNGATLCPFAIKEQGLKSFCVWLAEKEITICRLIPTLLRNLPTVHHPGVHFPTIRLLYVGGEVVTSRDVALFQQLFSPTALFVHVFGASETGIFRTYYLSAQTATVPAILPVGYALDDTEVWIADDAGQPLGVNEIGEIMVESRYLALGYWQNPTLTATVFLPSTTNPDRRLYRTGDLGCLRSDGCLEFHGRKDQQVKVRGYRVEIGIIEATLARLPEVKACTVTFDISTGEEYLCAYLVLYPSQQLDTRTVRAHLRESLPEYMMPAAFVLLDDLPTLPNGKVDRYALPKPLETAMQDSTTVTAPRTPTEQRLLVIWSALLGLEQIDIHVLGFRHQSCHHLSCIVRPAGTQPGNVGTIAPPAWHKFVRPYQVKVAGSARTSLIIQSTFCSSMV
jgi:acyl-coenzyme A synthetase/AMP-(fatty) acid ligase